MSELEGDRKSPLKNADRRSGFWRLFPSRQYSFSSTWSSTSPLTQRRQPISPCWTRWRDISAVLTTRQGARYLAAYFLALPTSRTNLCVIRGRALLQKQRDLRHRTRHKDHKASNLLADVCNFASSFYLLILHEEIFLNNSLTSSWSAIRR